MKRNQNNIYIFSQTKFQKFLARNLEKVILLLSILILITFVINKSNLNIKGLIFSLFFLNIASLIYIKAQKKFAYKIIIDFKSKKIKLYLHRSGELITIDLDSIKKIRVNGYIIFNTKDKKVYYNDCSNIELLQILNKVKTIEWGKLCYIWGPSKKTRDSIDGQNA
jgi:hypothetical protein